MRKSNSLNMASLTLACLDDVAGKLKVLPSVNMTPVMAVRVRTVQMSAILRVNLSPVLDDLPFIGGIALSFMTQPYLDFDLRYCCCMPTALQHDAMPGAAACSSTPCLECWMYCDACRYGRFAQE